ncbi:cytochrome P450 [Amycolatopsis sp. K13G38]|uniref:Cytochrome P450 n=1 Tax=Amycolatopsis acididurans TaxID=2724524 RepID=A0ABX1JE21_9PSEU|nr:cytochrome P450 [Amycolatopsis acididurans]NKQ56731.1 cytochrome P450 [Amycolatopsis acididurans]
MDQTTSIEALREQRRRDYDVYAQTTIAEHLTDLADRREKCPVSFSADGGFWVLSSYDDMSNVLRRNNRGFISFPNMPDGSQAFGQKRMIPLEIDGSLHRQYRQILDPFFSPDAVAKLEPQIRKVANDLIDKFIEKGHCDFDPDFAFPYPGTTFLALMGWPLQDAPKLTKWVDVFLHGIPGAPQEETDKARAEASAGVHGYVMELIEKRKQNRTDDITSQLLEAEIDGEPIPLDDLFDLFLVMMLAGLDTVQSVLGQSMAYLARNQDKWAEMFSSPEVLAPAIEELLRWSSPAVPTRNVDAETAKVGDLDLPKGERVHCPLGAANRDPKYFEDPDEVKFDRPAKPHLTFGLGAHRCVGVHLAKLELRIAFEELHRRIPSFRLADGVEVKEHLGLTWGVENVELAFEPGPRENA